MALSDPISFRRRVAGAALIVAPLVFVVAELLHARFEMDAGRLLIGIGLHLARVVPAWSAALIAVSQPVGFLIEFAGGPKAPVVAAQVLFAIGAIPVGLRVLRQSDEEWVDATSIAPATPLTA